VLEKLQATVFIKIYCKAKNALDVDNLYFFEKELERVLNADKKYDLRYRHILNSEIDTISDSEKRFEVNFGSEYCDKNHELKEHVERIVKRAYALMLIQHQLYKYNYFLLTNDELNELIKMELKKCEN
jgi:hypothetical protein